MISAARCQAALAATHCRMSPAMHPTPRKLKGHQEQKARNQPLRIGANPIQSLRRLMPPVPSFDTISKIAVALGSGHS
jgi:hypothetical protein